ncbi:MAG: ribosome maturation factor RimP [Pseudomonadota bacterium]
MVAKSSSESSVITRLRAVAEPLCQSENMELVHTEILSAQSGPLIRFTIDKPGGVTLDDCVHITRLLGDVLDVHMDDLGSYRLEISSPGPNRPLTKESDFIRFMGKRVRIELDEPMDGRKRFTGVLKRFSEGTVELALDRDTVVIRFEAIGKAKLAGTYGE